MISDPDYILTTPCKNEEKSLPKLAESIVNQSITPNLWLIVNDNSNDNSAKILRDLEAKYDWIHVVTSEGMKRDLSFHYANIVNNGMSEALKICSSEKIPFKYIALIDADMILEKCFFEKMIEKFENDPQLGVASGSTAYFESYKLVTEKGRDDLPIGGLRVWKKACFIETGGFPISYSADSVSNVLAILHGWKTKKFDDILGTQTRRTGSAEGLWKGYRTKGESDYYRDYHPLYVLFKFIKYSFTHPFYLGIAYMGGYIKGIVKIRKKLDIPEVRQYYRKKHLEIGRYYARKLKL